MQRYLAKDGSWVAARITGQEIYPLMYGRIYNEENTRLVGISFSIWVYGNA